MQIAAEKERIARETNKNLSLGQIEIRRSYSRKDEELRGKVFSELRDRLARFMETPKYDALLEAQIKKEKAFAGSSEIRQGKAESFILKDRLRHPRQPVPVSRRHAGRHRLEKYPDR